MLLRSRTVLNSVAPATIFTKSNYVALQAKQAKRLATLASDLNELKGQKAMLDATAHKYPDRYAFGIFGYLVAQNALLFHWTYQRFDWNLVEPITYLLGYSTIWLCTTVYFACGKEFTYDNLRQHLEQRKRDSLYEQADFDLHRFNHGESERFRLARLIEKDRL